MSTRGLYGFRKNSVDKLEYNHNGSYPEYLGRKVLEFLADTNTQELSDFVDGVILVDEDSYPPEEVQNYCLENGYGNPDDMRPLEGDNWYWLLRNIQGDFDKYKEIMHEEKRLYMIDGRDFIKDSLMCEYAYIINLDKNVLEFYVGFQKKPNRKNRYGCLKNKDGYYPCKCVLRIPFSEIEESRIDSLVEKMATCDRNI